MDNSFEALRHTFRKHRNRTIVAAIVCIVIFAAVLIGCCHNIYFGIRDNLSLHGEINAIEAAKDFDRHMSLGTNSIKLAELHIERLLNNGASDDEILNYLTTQSEDIKATMDKTYTSLYGYINGRYLDGSGWMPAEDYVPTERPWYVETMEMQQDIAYVRPYLDSKSGMVIMTITALLPDKESVIALDIGLGELQETNEIIASGIKGSQNMVLDSECYVVAHSDKNELGKNYISEQDTLGGEIAQKVWAENDFDFAVTVGLRDYIVVATKIEGGWFSVSAICTNGFYHPLIAMTIFSFAATLAAVIVLIVILVRKRNRIPHGHADENGTGTDRETPQK